MENTAIGRKYTHTHTLEKWSHCSQNIEKRKGILQKEILFTSTSDKTVQRETRKKDTRYMIRIAKEFNNVFTDQFVRINHYQLVY